MTRRAVLVLPKSGEEISCSIGYIDESCGVWPRLAIAIAKHRAASVDTLPKGQDAKQGLAGTEGSAVANSETPAPSPAQPGDA